MPPKKPPLRKNIPSDHHELNSLPPEGFLSLDEITDDQWEMLMELDPSLVDDLLAGAKEGIEKAAAKPGGAFDQLVNKLEAIMGRKLRPEDLEEFLNRWQERFNSSRGAVKWALSADFRHKSRNYLAETTESLVDFGTEGTLHDLSVLVGQKHMGIFRNKGGVNDSEGAKTSKVLEAEPANPLHLSYEDLMAILKNIPLSNQPTLDALFLAIYLVKLRRAIGSIMRDVATKGSPNLIINHPLLLQFTPKQQALIINDYIPAILGYGRQPDAYKALVKKYR